MCGIFAKVALKGEIAYALCQRQLRKQNHRGPDGDSDWVSPNRKLYLGHNLLSLTGTRGVRQPFSSEDGTITATVNGEFYGYQEIREELQGKGHRFASDSDSEILIHLYEEYGEQCLKKLRGEFAFALWDERSQKLFCARDRFGIKPFQFQLTSTSLTLASEAKAILSQDSPARWNPDALMRTLTHQYLAPDETLFQGIHQLPPAHTLVYRNGQLKISSYWTPPTWKNDVTTEALLDDLKSAVIDRLHPRAAFSLSGGIDSSAVVALASQHLQKHVPAFSVSFDHSEYDELASVTASAWDLGVRLTPVFVSRSDLLSELPKAVKMSEGLAVNGQLVGKFMLSRAIAEAGHRVVISGEGADEALLGYAHLLSDAGENLPTSLPLQRGLMLPSDNNKVETPLPSWLERWPTFLHAKVGFCQQFGRLLDRDFLAEMTQKDPLSETMDTIERLGFSSTGSDYPHQSAWLWTKLALANAILKTLGDGTEMTHSIEGRLPFLDHQFFGSAWKIPTSSKIKGGQSKAVFRKATSSLLPSEISQREKHPFIAPPLLSNPTMTDRVREQLQSSVFEDLSFFNQSACIDWFEEASKGNDLAKQQADPVLHTLLSIMHLQNSYTLSL